jgi:nucleotide-binding universal stress UspA family protein
MAKASRATLTILHVVVPVTPIVPEQYIDAQTWVELDQQARRWAQQQLRKLTARAKAAGTKAVVGLLVEGGNPAELITRTARSRGADLLVVGTHGRTGLAKFFVGSVASRVVATASCPVVTVRGT